MINIQLDEAVLTQAIANAVASAMYPKTESPDDSAPKPATQPKAAPIKKPAHSYAYKIEKAKRHFTEHATHTAPATEETALYNTWVKIFGHKPVTAAEFLVKARTHGTEVTITTFLRSANNPSGVGLKLSEYAAHHGWLKKSTFSTGTPAVYGVPKPFKNQTQRPH